MFIIIESGSTKADWVVVHNPTEWQFYKTEGINPSTQSVFSVLEDQPDLQEALRTANSLYYYGAGISDNMSKTLINDWVTSHGFNGHIEIYSDLMGACRAAFGRDKGIVCILGTGSNSCVYDGNEAVKSIISLGYILSDEGGGTHIGKEILKAYFYDTMPSPEKLIFEQNYSVSKALVIENLYKNHKGSSYLASFVPFLGRIESDWKNNLIRNIFKEFIALRLMKYAEYKTYPITFVGSVAFIFKDLLERTLSEYDLKPTEIIRQPIHKLIDYHLKNFK